MSPFVASVVSLPRALPPVLGVGAYLKNALCLIQGAEAWISRENGSLESVEAITRFEETANGLIEVASIKPVAVAHDWHPDFPCTRWAQCKMDRKWDSGSPLNRGVRNDKMVRHVLPIQHHHAHVAAVMAEHGSEGPVLGLALDGFGLGERNEAWGGELLRVDASGFRRLGHLRTLLQVGGDVAARQPWRMGAAALWSLGRGEEIAARYADQAGSAMLVQMMERGLNAPLTSSAGRLFDAACGLLGVLPVARFEGEAPMKLESMATSPVVDTAGWRIDDEMVLDMGPTLAALADMQDQERGANLFHGTLAAALVDWVGKAAAQTGIRQVALCGGCFLNKVLRQRVVEGLRAAGLEPLLPKQLPVGDTAIALGQAYAGGLALETMGEGSYTPRTT